MAIVIVGAGIGGLTTALSLHQAGFRDIAVYERAAVLRPLGVGINLLPHAVRELTELGLGERVAGLGSPRRAGLLQPARPADLEEPRGLDAGYRWPQLSVHRGRFQLELLAVVRDRLGADAVHTGHRLVGVQDGVARFETAAGEVRVTGDLIVGADGIHSILRRHHHPGEERRSGTG